MKEWEKDHISAKAIITPGYAFDSPDFKDYGVPVIKIANVKIGTVDLSDNSTQYVEEYLLNALNTKYRVKNGDILVSLTGSHLTQPDSVVGRVGRYRYTYTALVNQRAAKIDAIKGRSDKDFVYHLLSTSTLRKEIAMLAHGAANQANVSHKDIEKIKVFWPALPVQRKIAAVLSAYDDLNENNKRRIAILEKMAEELYREWFVRLRFPGHEKVKVVKGVPEGWEVRRVGNMLSFDKGISYSGEYLTETGTPLINLKCFNVDGTFRLGGVKPYSGKVQPQHIVHEGDIVIANTDLTQSGGIIGNPAIVPKIGDYGEYYYSHHLNAVRFPYGMNLTFYYYQLFKSSSFKLYSKGCASGTTVLGFRQGDIEKYSFLYPGDALAQEYNRVAMNIQKQIDRCDKTNELLTITRDRLLSRLMSGKIDVEKMDIRFPESMKEEGAAHA